MRNQEGEKQLPLLCNFVFESKLVRLLLRIRYGSGKFAPGFFFSLKLWFWPFAKFDWSLLLSRVPASNLWTLSLSLISSPENCCNRLKVMNRWDYFCTDL
jgi:hypothetical protein